MATLCEKALFARNYGEGVLGRLHYALHSLKTRSDEVLPTNKEYGKIIKKIADSFPNEPKPDVEQMQGYDVLKSKEPVIRTELRGTYEAVLAILEFRDAILTLAQETHHIVAFELGQNPLLIEYFMDCILIFVQVHLILNEMLSFDIKTSVCVFAHASKIADHTSRQDFSRVCQILVDVEKYGGVKNFPHLFEIDKAGSAAIGQIARGLMQPFFALLGDDLAKTGLLNPIHTQEHAALPFATETYSNHLIQSKIVDWILVAFVVAPGELAIDGSMEILKLALNQGWMSQLVREQSFDTHKLLEYVFEKYDKKGPNNKLLSKKQNKTNLEEASLYAVTDGLQVRSDRRAVLIQELKRMLAVFRDQPGLIGPKAEMAICCLSLVKQEVKWLFRHEDKQIGVSYNSKLAKKINAHLLKDRQLADLVHLSMELRLLMEQYLNIIQTYYAEFLVGLDLTTLKKQLSSVAFDPPVKHCLEAIVNQIQSIDPGAVSNGNTPNLEEIRLQIVRAQGLLSDHTHYKEAQLKALTPVLMTILSHTRLVDDWWAIVQEHISLGELYFYWEQLEALFTSSLNGGNSQTSSCLTFIRLMNDVAYHIHPQCPEDHRARCGGAEQGAERLLQILREFFDKAFNALIQQFVTLDVQSLDPVQAKHTGHSYPGPESEFPARIEGNQTWMHVQNVLGRILIEMERTPCIQVNSNRIYPKEYIRAFLHQKTRVLLRAKAEDKNDKIPMLPPTQFLARLRIISFLGQWIDRYLNLNHEFIIRAELLRELHSPTTSMFGSTGADEKPENSEEEKKLLIVLLGEWVVDYVLNKIDHNIVISKWSNSLVTVGTGSSFRIERYLNSVELQALAEICGPYGIMHVDQRLRGAIEAQTTNLKKLIQASSRDFQSFMANYFDPSKIVLWTELKKFRDKEATTQILINCVTIGKLLTVRSMLLDALKQRLQQRSPEVFQLCSTLQACYHESGSRVAQIRPAEILAATVGCTGDVVDGLLFSNLTKLCTSIEDVQLWKLLPVAVVAGFSSSFWKTNCRFDTSLAAFSNNAQCISTAVVTLTSAFSPRPRTIIPRNPQGASDEETMLFRDFFAMASFVVLHMKAMPDVNKEYSVDNLLIFLDQMLSETRALSSVPTESFLPYTLVRAAYANCSRGMKHYTPEDEEPASTGESAAVN
eukprot:c25428_g1_i1.p1 GENE.c25428_g1_i1~~c25428_g1_i1.p1  ORF type:complete len:1181 (+),score=255.13 c25428_g1_i1:48-3545(+)